MAYGYTGKILRVNLTTKEISSVPTDAYAKDYLGGRGMAYKIMFDEVPPATKAHDPENKVIFAIGPMTGSGVPCSSRLSVVSLMAFSPYHGLGEGHLGGQWAAQCKYAGWDSVIVEGVSETPCYIAIKDDKVTIEDASHIWGKGVYDATAMICAEQGKDASVAAIGQAGENMVPMSCVLNDSSHSGGGTGSVLGSKNLKAISVIGTGPVKVKNPAEMMALNEYMLKDIIGCNNQGVVPQSPQPWAPLSGSTRWRGREDRFWGAADEEVCSGPAAYHDVNMIGFRTMKGYQDFSAGEKLIVHDGGCQSCPIACHTRMRLPGLTKIGGFADAFGNTCVGWGTRFMNGSGRTTPLLKLEEGADPASANSYYYLTPGDKSAVERAIAHQAADNYGVWCNYGQITGDWGMMIRNDREPIKKLISQEEYDSIPWEMVESGDPNWQTEVYRRIAYKEGKVFEALGKGFYGVCEDFGFDPRIESNTRSNPWSLLGHAKHHDTNHHQVGKLLQIFTNRDPQDHTNSNLSGCGLPIEYRQRAVQEVYALSDLDGADIVHNNPVRPMNVAKARMVKFINDRHMVHDNLTLCNWMWPMWVSASPERDYRGDMDLEAKFMSALTGETYTSLDLDRTGERTYQLLRAYTALQMKAWGQLTNDSMFDAHDWGPIEGGWQFTLKEGQAYFDTSTSMEPNDFQTAIKMCYEQYGWNEKGIPQRARLEELNMAFVADKLEAAGLK